MSNPDDEQQSDQSAEQTTAKLFTDICFEPPTQSNPYVADKRYLQGYDIEQLAANVSPVDILFLQFSGQLPASSEHSKILQMLMVYLSTPSPRESASRAAIAVGVSKTNAEHILPISLMSVGGENSGAVEVQHCYQFIDNNFDKDPQQLAEVFVAKWQAESKNHVCAGFGQLYGDIDGITGRMFAAICDAMPQGETLNWLKSFNKALNKHNAGVLEVGLAAGVFHQLGMRHRESVGLYQLLKAPGLLAYGMEQTHKPVSTMPMLEDSQYELKK